MVMLRYMVDGFKAILYTGGGAINQATDAVAIVAAIGAAALALNMLKKPKGEGGNKPSIGFVFRRPQRKANNGRVLHDVCPRSVLAETCDATKLPNS